MSAPIILIWKEDRYFIENNKSDLLKSWGTFKADKQNLSILGKRNSEAVKLFDRADWK